MKAITGYLIFDGNARDAMTFYADLLGAELTVQSFKDAGMASGPDSEDRVIHARLSKGSMVLMASDTMPGVPFIKGNNFHISLECEGLEEIEKLFNAFGEGGHVAMALADTFWGARFGMVNDKYGVGWMFNYELPKSA